MRPIIVTNEKVQREYPNLSTLEKLAKDNPDQVFHAYKLVRKNNREGMYFGKVKYLVGKTVRVVRFDNDPMRDCGRGLNLATNDWCKFAKSKKHIMKIKVSFLGKNLVCVPFTSETNVGKFRVKRCTVLT